MRRAARAMAAAWLLAAVLAPAMASELPRPVVAALARAGVPQSAVAAVVAPVEDGRPSVFHNARSPMNMASVMKLVTAAAALELLGPAFAFRTDVLAVGELRAGVLHGDLVLRGGGDPKLTYEQLWRLFRQLRARGLREVRGDLVIDRGYFAPSEHDPGKFDNEPHRAYNVGADALLINFQAVNFSFIPGDGAVRVTGEPDLPNVEIASRIELTGEPCGAWRRGLRHDVRAVGLMATVEFSGTYPADCGERTWALAVLDAAAFAESNLRWLWSETGGVLRGEVRTGAVPPGARLLYRHHSEPLANLVRDMNKHSNNVVARHLFLALSAEARGLGEAGASARLVAEWLRSRAIEAPELVIENGSGLSRDERAAAATIAEVLRASWASPLMPELAGSLPILAVDGTLKSRDGGAAVGQAHLKGGTLAGVQSVAGYVMGRDGKRRIVVMAINHPAAGAARPALDALVEWAHRGGDARRGRT